MSSPVKGIDVSDFQGEPDFYRIRRSGEVDFIVAKASEGLDFEDPSFSTFWRRMREAGFVRGAYHFARPQPGRTGSQEAAHFLRTVHAAGGFEDEGDLAPVLDIEWSEGLSESELYRWVHDFCRYVRRHTGRTPIIYTGSWWREHLPNVTKRPYNAPLWLAAYVSDPDTYVPAAWRRWRFWQYSDKGSVPGISGSVDVDVFKGGRRRFRRYSRISIRARARRAWWRRKRRG